MAMRSSKQLLYVLFVISLQAVLSTSSVGQEFDEEFSTWPEKLKINGTVIAGGGGTLPEDAKDLFKRFCDRDDAKSIIIYFRDSAAEPADELLDAFDEKPTLVEVSKDSAEPEEKLNESLEDATAVWIASDGGISAETRQVISKLMPSISTTIEKGGVVCCNGGVAEMFGKYSLFSLDSINVQSAEANLVPDTILYWDYEDQGDRRTLQSMIAALPLCVGIGVNSDSAIVLNRRKIQVIGEGQATFLVAANEYKPWRIQHVVQPSDRRFNPYEYIVDLTAWRRDAIERTLPPYPADQPPVPHVENGTLFIVGGGGTPRGLMSNFVEKAGGSKAKIVYVPCSESDTLPAQQRTVEMFKRLGVESAVMLHTKDRNQANSDKEFLEPLRDATGIWFGGGRQWNFSDSYYGTEAHRLMKEVLERDGVVGGSSAGASIQARYMARANPIANFDIMADGYERGLGFISGVAIDQHFSQRGRQKDMTQLVDRYPQLLGIGIDEGTALIVEKSKAKIVGRGKVFFYDRNMPVVPGEPDYIALDAGQEFDLAERAVVRPENSEGDWGWVLGGAEELATDSSSDD